MTPARPAPGPALRFRPLAASDLGDVVAIDQALAGRLRRGYFERRLAAARRRPDLHAQFAVLEEGALGGFVFGRVLQGEFGRADPALRLETIGVRQAAQGRGLGAALCGVFEDEARRRGLKELRTTASWRSHAMLRFLDRGGWSLGHERVFDCALRDAQPGGAGEAPVALPDVLRPGDANDYGAPAGNDFPALARDVVDVGVLKESDLEGILRIDRRHTGRDRSAFLRQALAEALGDSAVRVSLAARADGGLAGFLMAQVDLGDFGRTEPVAVIDAIGVDPLRASAGFGRALLSQLVFNLAALGVDRVETVVAPGDSALLGFFHRAGLRPSERLAFVKRLG